MTSVYIVIVILGGLAAVAFFKGWGKTCIAFAILAGVMLAATVPGAHLHDGTQAGVDGLINTAYAFFH